jgi:hypothetical protein
MKTHVNLSKILTPEELQWFGQWLSKSQMQEGIKSHPGASHSVIFNVLEAARSRVEDGLPPYGDLWENPSEEETRQSIEGLTREKGLAVGRIVNRRENETMPVAQTDAGLPGGFRGMERRRAPSALHFHRHAR